MSSSTVPPWGSLVPGARLGLTTPGSGYEPDMKILIAVDASDANHAIAAAARRLFPHDEHLIISAASVAPYIVTEPFAGGAFVMGPSSMAGVTAAEETADEAVHSAQQVLGDESATSMVEIGDPGQVICEQAASHGADVIVVGRSSKSWISRLFDPSVSEYVIRHAPCPVLVVGERHPDVAPEPVPVADERAVQEAIPASLATT